MYRHLQSVLCVLLALVAFANAQGTPTRSECLGLHGSWIALPGGIPDVEGICLLDLSSNMDEASNLAADLEAAAGNAAAAVDNMISGFTDLVASVVSIVNTYQDIFIEICDIVTEANAMGCWYTDPSCSLKRGDPSKTAPSFRKSLKALRQERYHGVDEAVYIDGRLFGFFAALDDLLDDLDWEGLGFGEGSDCFSDLSKKRGERLDLFNSFGDIGPSQWPDWVSVLVAFLKWSQELDDIITGCCEFFDPFKKRGDDDLRDHDPVCCTGGCDFDTSEDKKYCRTEGGKRICPDDTCSEECCELVCAAFGFDAVDACIGGKRSDKSRGHAIRALSKRDEFDDNEFLMFVTAVQAQIRLGQAQISAQREALTALSYRWHRILTAPVPLPFE